MNRSQEALATFQPYLAVTVGEHLLALPLGRITDVFKPRRLTRVPLAPAQLAGLLNLYGRVLIAIDLRRELGLLLGRPAEMAVAVEPQDGAYVVLVESIQGIVRIAADSIDPLPKTVGSGLTRVAKGVHRRNDRALAIIDLDAVLAAATATMAA